ncbi:hypothetical protein O0I10_001695 [Lichtheimia ornata]|uniref:CCHC-type domain-containing protein n=1 Tax=Lichtheimia ornata TaxID=688661 RepID=A0AAD7VCN6_9FUNG|nr:uncharacterized protein O0I10_001695 [Lichtheimia ornata]KAJ8662731.1 hypothetical protein O0I10_001695 [Lichtheimia ornata]
MASTLQGIQQPPVNLGYWPAPINTTGGQCSWCGKYGHQRGVCPYLKSS